MAVTKKKLAGVFEVAGEPRLDERGYLVRLFDERLLAPFGVNLHWLQESFVHTVRRHTLRGLHVSLPPAEEGKMITAIKGEVLWVVVDLRKASPTFGKWDRAALSGDRHNVLIAGRGFAHGCLSLTDNCDLLVKADNYFSEAHATGIIWNDLELQIDWGLGSALPVISPRDQSYQTFKEFLAQYGGFD